MMDRHGEVKQHGDGELRREIQRNDSTFFTTHSDHFNFGTNIMDSILSPLGSQLDNQSLPDLFSTGAEVTKSLKTPD